MLSLLLGSCASASKTFENKCNGVKSDNRIVCFYRTGRAVGTAGDN